MKLGRFGLTFGAIGLVVASLTFAEAPSMPAGNYFHPTRPYGVAGILFFTSMTAGLENDVAAANKVRSVTGTDEGVTRKFLAYARDAVRQMDEEMPLQIRELCGRRAELDTIPRLAAAISEVDARLELRRAQLFRGAETVLGTAGMLRLEGYLSTKDTTKQPTNDDYVSKLLSRNESPEQILSRLCK